MTVSGLQKLLFSALLITAALVMPGRDASAQDKVRLAYTQTLYSAHVIIAFNKGYFEKHKLAVDPQLFARGKLTLDAVMAGAADICTTAEAPMTAAVMAKRPIAMIARLTKAFPTTVVSTEVGIEKLQDLRGKRVAFTSGSGNEVHTYAVLRQAGVDPKDVQFVNLRVEDMAAALMNRSVDAITAWQPHVANALRLGGDKVKVLDTRGIYTETWNLVAMSDYVKDNPAIIERLVKALLDAETFMTQNRDEAIDIVAKAVGIDANVVKTAWPDFEFKIALDDYVLKIMEAHTKWRLETGNHPEGVKEMPNYKAQLLAPDILKSAAPDRVSLAQ